MFIMKKQTNQERLKQLEHIIVMQEHEIIDLESELIELKKQIKQKGDGK